MSTPLFVALVQRYGRAKAEFIVGAACWILVLVIVALLALNPPLSAADLRVITVRPRSVEIVDRGRRQRDEIRITAADGDYRMEALWRRHATDESLLSAIRANETITLWLKPDDRRAFGLSAPPILVPHDEYLEDHAENRTWGIILAVAFFIGGCICLVLAWLDRGTSIRTTQPVTLMSKLTRRRDPS